MKILIISGYFAPYQIIGAQRVCNFVKYLLAQGHDIRVITAAGHNLPRTLLSPIDQHFVYEVEFLDANKPLEYARKFLSWISGNHSLTDGGAFLSSPTQNSTSYRLANMWRAVTNIPDNHVGWIPHAIYVGKKLTKSWHPDVIFASALPFSTAVVAQRLAQAVHCPWVVEFRDLWYGNPYLHQPAWRALLDKRLEAQVLRSVGHITTVSEPLARELHSRYSKPVGVVTNGFDPDEFPFSGGKGNPDQHKLTIYYGGTIYTGKRDPLPLFKALNLLGDQKQKVEITFSGQDLRGVMQAAHHEGVESCVRVTKFKSRSETISTLLEADIALLLLWNDPREEGVYSGKLFEYIGSQRPILMLGYKDGVAANLIRNLNAGFISNSPETIASIILKWIKEKEELGYVPPISHPNRLEYSFIGQFSKQEQVLNSLVKESTRELL